MHACSLQGFHQGFVLALQHAAQEPEDVKQALRELLQGVEEEQAQQAGVSGLHATVMSSGLPCAERVHVQATDLRETQEGGRVLPATTAYIDFLLASAHQAGRLSLPYAYGCRLTCSVPAPGAGLGRGAGCDGTLSAPVRVPGHASAEHAAAAEVALP